MKLHEVYPGTTSLLGTIAAAVCLSLICSCSAATAADRIILRDLKIISDRTVVDFDVDGVRLDDGSRIGWYNIEKATIAADKQAEFNRLLAELGDDLFRLRQRLRVGDYKDLLPHAEALYPRYANRSSATAYMVFQSAMWSRIAVGRREEALEPYLLCYQYLRSRVNLLRGPGGATVDLPGQRRLDFDLRSGLSAELDPIWFDPAAAKAAMPRVFKAIAGMSRPRPEGVYIYYATLALAAGDDSTAERMLGAVSARSGSLAELRQIVAAQREVVAGKPGEAITQLESQLDGLSGQTRPLALYWLGISKLLDGELETRQRGLLRLLRIPALYGNEHPELAAAALYRSMQLLAELKDVRGSVALRNELLVRYGQTFFASKVKSSTTDDPSRETP